MLTLASLVVAAGTDDDWISGCTIEFDNINEGGNVYTIGTTSGAVPDGKNLGGLDLFMSKYDISLGFEYSLQFGTDKDDFSFAFAGTSGQAGLPGQGGIYANSRQTGGGNDKTNATTDTALVWASMTEGR